MVKNGFFGHFETYFWTILGFQSEGKKDDFMKIGGPKRGPKNGSKIGHFGHFLDPFFGPISGV